MKRFIAQVANTTPFIDNGKREMSFSHTDLLVMGESISSEICVYENYDKRGLVDAVINEVQLEEGCLLVDLSLSNPSILEDQNKDFYLLPALEDGRIIHFGICSETILNGLDPFISKNSGSSLSTGSKVDDIKKGAK